MGLSGSRQRCICAHSSSCKGSRGDITVDFCAVGCEFIDFTPLVSKKDPHDEIYLVEAMNVVAKGNWLELAPIAVAVVSRNRQ